jgi:hypothetical protein
MGCARCWSRRAARGSPTTESRPKVGPGRGSARVIPPARAYWDYAKAGHRLDSDPVLPRLLLSVRAYQSELEPQIDAIAESNCLSVRPKMERGFAAGYHNPRKSDVKAGAASLPLARGVIASNPKPARVIQVRQAHPAGPYRSVLAWRVKWRTFDEVDRDWSWLNPSLTRRQRFHPRRLTGLRRTGPQLFAPRTLAPRSRKR